MAELAEAMKSSAEIHDLAGRAGSYAMLSYSLDTADPARGALLQKARELGAAIETQLLFFDLEWNLVPEERADELLEAPELASAAHHLRTLRRYRPYQLSEPEERVLTETNVTGGSAFQRSSRSRPPPYRCRSPAGTSRPRSRRAFRSCRTPTASGVRRPRQP